MNYHTDLITTQRKYIQLYDFPCTVSIVKLTIWKQIQIVISFLFFFLSKFVKSSESSSQSIWIFLRFQFGDSKVLNVRTCTIQFYIYLNSKMMQFFHDIVFLAYIEANSFECHKPIIHSQNGQLWCPNRCRLFWKEYFSKYF